MKQKQSEQVMKDANTSFSLLCLVCDAGEEQIEPHNPSPLVAMQEHLMQEHGLEQKDFAQMIRHTVPSMEEECYEWSRLSGHPLIEVLHLSEGRIMRACRPR
jgi:hypothetical protein